MLFLCDCLHKGAAWKWECWVKMSASLQLVKRCSRVESGFIAPFPHLMHNPNVTFKALIPSFLEKSGTFFFIFFATFPILNTSVPENWNNAHQNLYSMSFKFCD